MVVEKGWPYFRDREAALLEQLLSAHGEGKVIVLGGGIVEREENRIRLTEFARTRGPVIHVCRNPEDVFAYLRAPQKKSTWAVLEEGYRVGTFILRLADSERDLTLTFERSLGASTRLV
jgi:shikimate kinase